MKKFVLLMFLVLATPIITNAQSMLCTYKGGYFIQKGNTWYEYRPQERDGIWAIYTQYSTDNNYYYIKNKNNSISVPKQSTNNIWIKRKNSSNWEVVYTTIKVYKYCPVHSSNIFTFDKGFFVKDGNTWELYLPEKRSNAAWAGYTQYEKDNDFYYIKNSDDAIAIPRKPNNDFFWRKNGKWETLYNTLAIYDGSSANQYNASGQTYANKEMSNTTQKETKTHDDVSQNNKITVNDGETIEIIREGNDRRTCQFTRIILADGMRVLSFYYTKDPVGHPMREILVGRVRAICNRRNFDEINSTYMLYEVIDPKAIQQGRRVCRINNEIAEYIKRTENQDYYVSLTLDQMKSVVGAEALQKAPFIKYEINCCKKIKTGENIYITPVSEMQQNKFGHPVGYDFLR